MTREVRRVPLDWDHPRGPGGHYLPLMPEAQAKAIARETEEEFSAEGTMPEGPGWQLYEDYTEGTPLSYVYETREQLVDHLLAEYGLSAEGVEVAIASGACGWMIFSGGRFLTGLQICEYEAHPELEGSDRFNGAKAVRDVYRQYVRTVTKGTRVRVIGAILRHPDYPPEGGSPFPVGSVRAVRKIETPKEVKPGEAWVELEVLEDSGKTAVVSTPALSWIQVLAPPP